MLLIKIHTDSTPDERQREVTDLVEKHRVALFHEVAPSVSPSIAECRRARCSLKHARSPPLGVRRGGAGPLPVMDGAALVKAMAADARLANIPVVIMSSMSEATVAERSPGYVAFVRKPFNIFAVVDLVAKLAGP